MFAHINPERDSFGETISTLKFAQRVSTVELGAARMNKESSEVMQLKEQVKIMSSFVLRISCLDGIHHNHVPLFDSIG